MCRIVEKIIKKKKQKMNLKPWFFDKTSAVGVSLARLKLPAKNS